MNTRTFMLGTLATAGVGFLLSFLWHVLLMNDFYAATSPAPMREVPAFWAVILAYLVVGAIMAYMYPKGHEGGSPVAEGLKFGIIIGVLWWFPTNLVLYGAMEGPFTLVLVDSAWHLVEQGVSGAVLGLVYGLGLQSKEATPAGEGHPPAAS